MTSKIGSGKTPRGGERSYVDHGIPLIRSQNINMDAINLENVAYITKETNLKMKQSIVKENDILLNITGASIGRSAVYKYSFVANVNQHVCIIRLKSNELADFFQFQLSSYKGQHNIMLNQAGGGREGLNFEQIGNLSFSLPKNLEEIIPISHTLILLSSTIALQQQQLDSYNKLKKGLLQRLFPKDGEKVPEVRFAKFHENWEQCKLEDILMERDDKILESKEYPLMSFVKDIGVTPKDNRYDRSFLVKSSNKKYKKTKLGDFIYSSNNLETGSIGFNKTGNAVISPVYSIFKSKNKEESQFIGILSSRKDFINKMVHYRQGVIYGQWRIHERDFLSIEIYVPKLEEREKIINTFRILDETIDTRQIQLENLMKLKSYLLQKLFI